jgi:hypothetical protein
MLALILWPIYTQLPAQKIHPMKSKELFFFRSEIVGGGIGFGKNIGFAYVSHLVLIPNIHSFSHSASRGTGEAIIFTKC